MLKVDEYAIWDELNTSSSTSSLIYYIDDGISPERVAQVMGQPDHCHHAVHIINELVQTAQVSASVLYLRFTQLGNVRITLQ